MQNKEDIINDLFSDDSVSDEGIFNKENLLNSPGVNDFIKKAPLREKVPNNKPSIITVYITKKLNDFLIDKSKTLKITKSKIITIAEYLYYESDVTKEDLLFSSGKAEIKVNFSYQSRELLLERAKEKGFNKLSEYIRNVLISKLDDVG